MELSSIEKLFLRDSGVRKYECIEESGEGKFVEVEYYQSVEWWLFYNLLGAWSNSASVGVLDSVFANTELEQEYSDLLQLIMTDLRNTTLFDTGINMVKHKLFWKLADSIRPMFEQFTKVSRVKENELQQMSEEGFASMLLFAKAIRVCNNTLSKLDVVGCSNSAAYLLYSKCTYIGCEKEFIAPDKVAQVLDKRYMCDEIQAANKFKELITRVEYDFGYGTACLVDCLFARVYFQSVTSGSELPKNFNDLFKMLRKEVGACVFRSLSMF